MGKTVTAEPDVALPPLDRRRLLVVSGISLAAFAPLALLLSRVAPREALPPLAVSELAMGANVALARKLIEASKPREALVLLARARKANPNDFAVYNNLCVAHGMLQNREEAISACQRALEVKPESQLGKNNLAWVQSISSAR
jgi:Flp pilus assembly protein TadD